jgi:putative oxidoreductase
MKKKILFVLSLLFGLMFINAGLNKFLNYMPMPEKMPEKLMKVSNAFVEIGWLMPLTGFVEILGGMLFIFPRTRALGAVIILPVMVGIVLTNTVTEPSGMPMALILLAINCWAIADNWQKYTPMFRQNPVYADTL